MKKSSLLIILALLSALSFSQDYKNLALTPPMGWNSWNCLRCIDLNENTIKQIADEMVESGMRDAGYKYLVIDDCWQIDRDADGKILADSIKFPSGMKALGEYIHSRGLLFGIYTCAGSKTCQGRPGSRGYQFSDALQYAEWGVDFIKVDWCYSAEQNAKAAYTTMRDAIIESGRPMVLSICEWGYHEPWLWAKNIGHMWRTTLDIRDCWDCVFPGIAISGGVITILDFNKNLARYAGPGSWNDADMLEVGNESLSFEESKAHFSLWAMMASPLMAGNDIRTMNEETKRILTNKEIIEINQDSLGKQAEVIALFNNQNLEVYQKVLTNNKLAICFFNRDDKPYDIDISWAMIEIEGNRLIRDLWQHKNIGTTIDKPRIEQTMPAHSVLVYLLSPIKM